MSHIAVGLFDSLEDLRFLDLAHNMFHELPSLGLSSALIRELDISFNFLKTLNIFTFRDMVKLRGMMRLGLW